MFSVTVDLAELSQPEIDSVETYFFENEDEATKFRDHLRDLYGLDVNIADNTHFDTYDSAIQHFVELAGPSKS